MLEEPLIQKEEPSRNNSSVKNWLFDLSRSISIQYNGYLPIAKFIENILTDIADFNEKESKAPDYFFEIDEQVQAIPKDQKNKFESIVYEFEVSIASKKWR